MRLYRNTTLFVLLALATLVIAIRRLPIANAEQTAASTGTLSSWDQLELKAVATGTGDEAAIHELAHSVFRPFSWADREDIRGASEDRIARAEIAFRHGQHAAISENDVVRAINKLAQNVGAPDYAKTDLTQIRHLRFGLAMSVPHLVGTQAAQAGSALSHSMSPTEATYIALSMLHQKLYNPKYQVTSKEWSEARHREDWQRWNNHRLGKDKEAPSGPRLAASGMNPKSIELHDAIRRATTRLSSGDISNLPNTLLDDMGVSR